MVKFILEQKEDIVDTINNSGSDELSSQVIEPNTYCVVCHPTTSKNEDDTTNSADNNVKLSDIEKFLTVEKCEDLLAIYGVNGIEYVISSPPKICRNFLKKTYNVQKETEEMQSGNVHQKDDASSYLQLGCFGYGYVGINASVAAKTSVKSFKYSKKNKKSNKEIAKTLIACEIARFDCSSLRLDADAIKLVEDIGSIRSDDEDEQDKLALEFLSKYPAEEVIYKSFAIGGWFSRIEKKSSEDSSEENKIRSTVTNELKHAASAKASYNGIGTKINTEVQNQNSESKSNDSISKNHLLEKNKNITYAGPLATTEVEILNGLADPHNWAVFPTPTKQQHNTKSIHDVIYEMADSTEGYSIERKERMRRGANVLKSFIKHRNQQKQSKLNTKDTESIRSMDVLRLSTENENYLGKPMLSLHHKAVVRSKRTVQSTYRIYKYMGSKGDVIRHGDIVMIQLTFGNSGQNILMHRKRGQHITHGHLKSNLEIRTHRYYWVIEGMKDGRVSYNDHICFRALNSDELKRKQTTEHNVEHLPVTMEHPEQQQQPISSPPESQEESFEESVLETIHSLTVGKHSLTVADYSRAYLCVASNGQPRLMCEDSVGYFKYNKAWQPTKKVIK